MGLLSVIYYLYLISDTKYGNELAECIGFQNTEWRKAYEFRENPFK